MKNVSACSFLPAATQMIYQMGLQDMLFGVTFECDSPLPKVVRSYIEDNTYSSSEIEKVVAEFSRTGRSLYYVDQSLLERLAPDVVFTQDVCNVCQVGTSYAVKAISRLSKIPKVVSLSPGRLTDVFDNVLTVAAALDRYEQGKNLVQNLTGRIARVEQILKKHNAPRRSVMFMEWLDPVYHAGHWIADQVIHAGGIDRMAKAGEYSGAVPWEAVLEYDPEVLVIAACGFDITRTLGEMHVLVNRRGWNELRAVQRGDVYIADGSLFTCPGTTVVDGIELLATFFHPNLFDIPEHLTDKYFHYSQHDLLHHGRRAIG